MYNEDTKLATFCPVACFVEKRRLPEEVSLELHKEVGVHCMRVGRLCRDFAVLMGWAGSQAERFQWVGAMHDMGKYLLPPDLLTKSETLTPKEMQLIRTHAPLGAEKYRNYIISSGGVPDPQTFQAIHSHHERYDGGGYPEGIKGDVIELSTQIISIADVIEALSADRCYRPAFKFDVVMEMIEGEKGKAWRTDLVDMVLSNQALIKANLEQITLENVPIPAGLGPSLVQG